MRKTGNPQTNTIFWFGGSESRLNANWILNNNGSPNTRGISMSYHTSTYE
jgi:hypothetical protein